jgi:hypothetical protein
MGTCALTFDASGTLLATRSENMPTTVWIWDAASRALKAVLVQHAPVAKISWHSAINEQLMIRCEGEDSKALVHLWEPSWDKPKIMDFGSQVPDGKIIGKAVIRWMNTNTSIPAVFFSDAQDCILASLAETEDDEVPWQGAVANGVDIYGQAEESPLNIAGEKASLGYVNVEAIMDDESLTKLSTGSEEVDDTFHFRSLPA